MGDPLLYGAYGYSGRLVLRRALDRGRRFVLAGRREEPLRRLAGEAGLDWRAFDLASTARIVEGLGDAPLVLNCAGPFEHTARPMVDGCVAAGRHYLDITGEIAVLEALAGRDDEARDAGVLLLPGVGFDVVATDCLAVHVARRLPSARRLVIGIDHRGGVSRGTAASMLQRAPRGGAVREDGVLRSEPLGARARRIDFGRGPRVAISIPWGDLATAYRSTGIPDIQVYATAPSRARRLLRLARPAARLLSAPPIRALARWWVRRGKPGPTDEERAGGWTRVWAQVADGEGGRATARLDGPEAYTFTARAAVASVGAVLDEAGPIGYRTPATAFGPDFVLGIEGVERHDLD